MAVQTAYVGAPCCGRQHGAILNHDEVRQRSQSLPKHSVHAPALTHLAIVGARHYRCPIVQHLQGTQAVRGEARLRIARPPQHRQGRPGHPPVPQVDLPNPGKPFMHRLGTCVSAMLQTSTGLSRPAMESSSCVPMMHYDGGLAAQGHQQGYRIRASQP